jgi:hypothetical protein
MTIFSIFYNFANERKFEMESKLNLNAIKDYSEVLSDIFMKELDSSKSSFNGSDILKLNEIKQVNLFIMKEIFIGWLSQMEESKSDYFDYENEDLKKAQADYMNVLSHQIRVKRADLKNLYSGALYDTILFYLVPDFFLTHLFQELNEGLINKTNVKRINSYIDLNKSLYASFQKKVESLSKINSESVIEILRSIPFEAEERDIFEYFSSKKPIDVEQFLNIEEKDKKEPNSEKDESLGLKEGKTFEFENEGMLHEKFKKQDATINDKLKGDKSPSLADNLQNTKINDLAKSVSLNQRFVFIKELFNGNLDNYEKALNNLNSFESWEEANQFIEEELATEYNWDISKKSVEEFNSIVQRKFR